MHFETAVAPQVIYLFHHPESSVSCRSFQEKGCSSVSMRTEPTSQNKTGGESLRGFLE